MVRIAPHPTLLRPCFCYVEAERANERVRVDGPCVKVHGCDAFGHPIVAERIEDIAPEGLSRNMDRAAVLRHRIQIMEAVAHLKRREAGRRGHELYKHIWVIDLAGIKVAHFTGDVRTFVLNLVQLCTERYTDTLFAMWLVNAPMVFRAVWSAVSCLLRQSTKEKIKIVGGGDMDKLKEKMAAVGRDERPLTHSYKGYSRVTHAGIRST